jgi:hypothetical protein
MEHPGMMNNDMYFVSEDDATLYMAQVANYAEFMFI